MITGAAAGKNPMDAAGVILAAIVVSSVGALFYNLLPLFLGAAQDSKGLPNSQIGFLSSAFFLGYNIATVSAFYWIRRWSWRLITLLAMPVAALGLFLTTMPGPYLQLLLVTALAGAAFATLYGIGTTILSDTSNPARWFGLKIAAEAGVGALLMLVLPGMLMAEFGFDGLIWGMLLAMVLLAPLLLLLPAQGVKSYQQEAAEYQDLDATPESLNHWAIWSALAATMVFFAGSSAVWAFMERLGANAGHASETLAQILAATLVCATLGSLAAAGLGKRFGNSRPFIVCLLLIIAALFLLAQASDFNFYLAGCCLFTVAFGAGLPFAVAEVAELDTDGRYAVLSVPAIGIGAMVGPGVAGVLYAGDSAVTILSLVAVVMVVAGLLMRNALRQRRL